MWRWYLLIPCSALLFLESLSRIAVLGAVLAFILLMEPNPQEIQIAGDGPPFPWPAAEGKVEDWKVAKEDALQAPEALAPDSPAIIHTNKREFYLPVSLDETIKSRTKEVRLYVSRDDGKTWVLSQTINGDKWSFPVELSEDGLFCFGIQTVDKNGMQWPDEMTKRSMALRINVTANQVKVLQLAGE